MGVQGRVGVAVLCAVLAGCSSEVPGAADPGPAAGSSTAVASELPERPRSFDLSVVDPCTLMPPERRAEFGLDRPPQGPQPTTSDPSVTLCTISSTTAASFGVFVDPGEPAAVRLEQTAPGAVLDTVEANGFTVPLLEGGDGDSCIAVIDVNDEGNLRVQANGIGRLTVAETCEAVAPWIQVVLDTLALQQPE